MMSHRSHGALGALLCLSLLAGGGCSGDLGALCSSDDDCRGGLRCLRVSEASRGTCAYPAAMSDLGPRADGSPLDLRDDGPGVDGPSVDGPSVDALSSADAPSSADATPPDGQSSDGPSADAPTADGAAADAAGDLPVDGSVDGGSAQDLASDATSAD